MPDTHEDDTALLERIARGEVDLLGPLYDRYASLLFPVALRILRSHAEAEDALHDVFVNLAHRAGYYLADRGSVATWLVAQVRNMSLDRLRRRKRRGSLELHRVAFEPPQPVPTPESESDEAGERARVRRALCSLPEASRDNLISAFYEGLTYREIAKREGIPVGTIKSRVNRSLVFLREALRDECRGVRPIQTHVSAATR
jgi:RNA polymerase sigma-70 factor, ECF subfamily